MRRPWCPIRQQEDSRSIFDVWLDSWTMTDLWVFGTAALAVIFVVFLRPMLASRHSADTRAENGGR